MTNFQKIGFVIVLILQLLVLAGIIAKRNYILQAGKTVLLECEPVDPRSLFSGDYVILNYKISRLNSDLSNKTNEFKRKDIVYVALQKPAGGQFWEAVEVSETPDLLQTRYDVVIRGRIEDRWRIRYGVEQYFVPQGQGLEIERELKKVSVEVSVLPSGESAVRRLFMDGQEIRFE